MSTPRASQHRSVVLVHWKAEELPLRVRRLAAAGYQTEALSEVTPAALHAVKRRHPAAVVIDLSRLPSHGQRVGEVIQAKSGFTSIPLVFVEGGHTTVARIRSGLPRAIFTSWRRLSTVLRKTTKGVSSRPARTVRSGRSPAAGYSGTPLPKKLGIREGQVVAVLNGPSARDPFWKTLPESVAVRTDLRRSPDVIVAFVTSIRDYARALPKIAAVLATGGTAWAAWPKKASGRATNLTEAIIREMALAENLVDIKVCAIDTTWSGLRLARRRR
ncbi:MAG: hypothetical protein AB7I50_12520 [Vicinamibacterales bacterium]